MADETTPEVEPQEEPARPPVSTMPESPATIHQRGLDQQRAEAAEPGVDHDAIWGALGEEAQQLRQNKKWDNPAELAKAYREAEGRLSQRDEEKEALIRYIHELEDQVPENPQPQQQAPAAQPGQPAALDFDALALQCIDPNTGEMNYGRMMEVATALGARMAFDAAEHRMNERFSQFESERVSPLTQQAEVERAAEELRGIAEAIGEEAYETLGARIEKEMESDPDFLERHGGITGAFGVMALQQAREGREAEARAADGFALTGGGRRPQQPRLSPEDAERVAMERMHLRPDDGL